MCREVKGSKLAATYVRSSDLKERSVKLDAYEDLGRGLNPVHTKPELCVQAAGMNGRDLLTEHHAFNVKFLKLCNWEMPFSHTQVKHLPMQKLPRRGLRNWMGVSMPQCWSTRTGRVALRKGKVQGVQLMRN